MFFSRLRPSLFDARQPVWVMCLSACLVGIVFAQGLQFSAALFSWVESNYGRDARERVENLQQIIVRNSDEREREKLELVNDFFNDVEYSSDNDIWDQKDYWATPYEVLGINMADCEDYALSKYFTLISMGVAEEKLRISYVKAIVLGEAHMVLAYYSSEDAEPLILDNITRRIRLASARTDLVPVYSFNGADLWLAVNRVKGRKVGGSERISRWQKFQSKLNTQMGG